MSNLRMLGQQLLAESLGAPRLRGVMGQQLQERQAGADLRQAAGAFRAIGTPRAVAFADRMEQLPTQTFESLGRAGMSLGALYGAMATEAPKVTPLGDGRAAISRPDGSVEFVSPSGAGGAQPLKFSDLTSTRSQFRSDSKDFRTVRDAYRRIRSVSQDPSAAGDLALIFSFMKILDPGSTVREGEFANAQNTAGVPGRLRSAYNRVVSGERLNPTQRADFLAQSENLFAPALQSQMALERDYQELATRHGANPSDVTVDYVGDLRSWQPSSRRPPQPDTKGLPPNAAGRAPVGMTPDGRLLYPAEGGGLELGD